MAFGIATHPTVAFEEAFDNPKLGIAYLTIILTVLISAFAFYLLVPVATLGVFYFISGLIQWFVFAMLVWFFSFAHSKKKTGVFSVSFSKIVSVTGKLWKINLVGAVVFAVVGLLFSMLSNLLLEILFVMFIILLVLLLIVWLVASAKMLKVLTDMKGAKLFVNWLILIIINALISGFLTLFLARLVPF